MAKRECGLKKDSKGFYRVYFTFPNGKQRDHRHRNKSYLLTVENQVKRLIVALETGIVDVEAMTWARSLIGRDDRLYKKLASWKLVPEFEAKEVKTIEALCKFFQNKGGVKKTTLQTYQMLENNLVEFFGSDCPLSEITVERASQFVRYLDTAKSRRSGRKADPNSRASKRGKRPQKEKEVGLLSEATKAKRIETARQFFSQAVKLKWLTENPFQYEHGGSRPNINRMIYINPDDAIRVIRETVNKRHRALIALWRFVGVRGAREFALLEWSAKCIRWSTTDAPGSITIKSPKTEKHVGHEQRTVPLTPFVESVLQDLFEEAEEGEALMFPGMKPASNPGKLVKTCFQKNGIELSKAYNLRESFCCDLMEAGIEPMAYEALAGHSLKIGLKFYQIYHQTRKQKADEKFLSIWKTGESEKSVDSLESSNRTDNVPDNVQKE